MHFSSLFRTTRLGAHGARHAAERWLADQLSPEESGDGDLAGTASLLIAELAANAALHGQVRGRDARLVVTLDVTELWVEVTDAHRGQQPVKCPDAGASRGADCSSSRHWRTAGECGRTIRAGRPCGPCAVGEKSGASA